MKGSYNNIAPYYDRVSKVIFGRALEEAQAFLLGCITPGSAILVVGGGTGWILDEIAARHPTSLQITYVEPSEKMMTLSKQRNTEQNEVVFITKPIDDVVFDRTFDFVITAFLFDNFSSATAASVFQKIDSVLRRSGRWLFSDFEISTHTPWWQKMLLSTMYLFFKLMCNIETNRLPDTSNLFKKYQYKVASSRVFFHSFIRSTIYIKR